MCEQCPTPLVTDHRFQASGRDWDASCAYRNADGWTCGYAEEEHVQGKRVYSTRGLRDLLEAALDQGLPVVDRRNAAFMLCADLKAALEDAEGVTPNGTP
jgi:hypothetical protein